jgi:hypothetical protein
MRITILALIFAAGFLAGCEKKREHYFVLCSERDASGWILIGTEFVTAHVAGFMPPERRG